MYSMSSQCRNIGILGRMKRIADSVHINLLLTRDLLEDVDKWWRMKTRLPNRTAAIRELLRFAINEKRKMPKPKGK